MMIQSQFPGTLREPDSERRLGAILRREPNVGRVGIARRVCQASGFLDAQGNPQLSGCLKALGAVERSCRIPLPASRVPARPPSPRRLEDPVPLEWHLRKRLAPMLFEDDDPGGATAQRKTPVDADGGVRSEPSARRCARCGSPRPTATAPRTASSTPARRRPLVRRRLPPQDARPPNTRQSPPAPAHRTPATTARGHPKPRPRPATGGARDSAPQRPPTTATGRGT